MILMKLASVLLLVLTLALAIIFSRFFKLKKKGINFADLAFPFLIFEYYLITGKVYTHNQLPILGAALSLLAIILAFFFLSKLCALSGSSQKSLCSLCLFIESIFALRPARSKGLTCLFEPCFSLR